jgi:PucR family transcriptional regulator, purine catabolism regulatory protein
VYVYPSVSEVLALPVMRRGVPKVVAGASGVDRRVRWVHAAEVVDIAHLLRGGELVLTTGIALPADPAALTRYVDELAEVRAAGIVVELIRRWSDELPAALIAAAERRALPLITLARETRFVAITEAVGALILDAQVEELRAAEAIHERFTALTVSGAEPAEILREVARSSGLPVVLETLTHHVLGYDAAGENPSELLANWEHRSRAVTLSGRTGYDESAGWLVTVVGARDDDWGRLVLLAPEQPSHRHVVVAERAASALALHRLVARDRDSLERQTHRSLLSALLSSGPVPVDLAARSAAVGVPLAGRRLVGVAVQPRSLVSPTPAIAAQEVLRDLAEATALAAQRAGVLALVGVVDDTSVRALLALGRTGDVDPALKRLAREVHRVAVPRTRVPPVVVAVGSTVSELADAPRSLTEASHVAEAALRNPLLSNASPGNPSPGKSAAGKTPSGKVSSKAPSGKAAAGTQPGDPAGSPSSGGPAGAGSYGTASGSQSGGDPSGGPGSGSSGGSGSSAGGGSSGGGEPAVTNGGLRPFYRLDDVRLRGLLHLLCDDSRVQAFVQRELGPLLKRDTEAARRLLDVLRNFCEHGGNKSAAATAAHLSRPAYYKLLARIERLLDVSLDEPESMLSLYVALLAMDSRPRT